MIGRLLEPQAASLTNPPQWLLDAVGISSVSSGVTVNKSTALNYSAVYAAIRVLSESVASLPLFVYRRLPDGGKEKVTDEPIASILHDSPNRFYTMFTMLETAMAHILTWGNGYAEIERDQRGDVLAIWLRLPNEITPTVENGEFFYTIKVSGKEDRRIDPEDMVHVPGLGYDGLKGYSPISLARESIGLGMATEKYGAAFFGNSSMPSGILTTQNRLGREGRSSLKEVWNAAHKGPGQSHGVAVLERGVEWKQIGIPPEDAQFLETRKFQIAEIARIYRVPPHMLGDLEKATFSNIEQQAISFVVHSLRPWLVRWEGELNRKLLGDDLFCEFLVDGLLRGDTKSRYEAYRTGITSGFLSRNEVRSWENLNPEDGLDDFLIQTSNMGPVGQPAIEPSETESQSLQLADNLVLEAHDRVLRKECAAVNRAIKRYVDTGNSGAFIAWLDTFYAEYEAEIAEIAGPAVKMRQKLHGLEHVDVAHSHVMRHSGALGGLVRSCSPDVLGEALRQMVAQWPACHLWELD